MDRSEKLPLFMGIIGRKSSRALYTFKDTLKDAFKNQYLKKNFNCPQCQKKLRVPIKPGKTLVANCSRCSGQILIDYKIPFIETFKWQSGKSLKLNLIDFHHRFWNLSVWHKFQVLLVFFLFASLIDFIFGQFLMPILRESISPSSDKLPTFSPFREI